MAKIANANRLPKNKIRTALATAAVITTLFGAQTLAFSEKAQTGTVISQPVAQEVSQQPTTVAVNNTTTSQLTTASTSVSSSQVTPITQAASQPRPSSKSSR
jgi:hypothetical protein